MIISDLSTLERLLAKWDFTLFAGPGSSPIAGGVAVSSISGVSTTGSNFLPLFKAPLELTLDFRDFIVGEAVDITNELSDELASRVNGIT
jgi:hypothetical protein